jgi:group I intron endonuclease
MLFYERRKRERENMNKHKSGIYQIRNIINGKVYIGSTIDFYKREYDHFWNLKMLKHHSPYLQKTYNKHGKDIFAFEIIETVENKNKLLEREQYWINFKKACNPDYGYNISPKAGSVLGRKFSQDTKNKIGNSNRGKKRTPEQKIKMSKASKGRIISEEHKQKLRILSTGRKASQETREKMSKSRIGIIFSEEQKRKISEHKKGIHAGAEHYRYGKHCSEETKKKISESKKGKTIGPQGERNFQAKLTEKQVYEIKELLGQGIEQKEIASRFNVGRNAIYNIKYGKTWKHITNNYQEAVNG